MILVKRWGPWVAVVVIAGVLLTYAQSAAGQQFLRKVGLVKQADRFVALSFANVQGLPYSVPISRKPEMPVTIENHKGNDVVYRLRATQGTSTKVLAQQAVIIPDGSSRTLNMVVPVTCQKSKSATNVRVTFTLTPSNHSISHIMLCRTAS